jgi:hypothetical protein
MLGWLAPAAGPAPGQTPTTTAAPETAPAAEAEGGPSTRDSSVGYIDRALISNLFRLRFDDNFLSNRPTRAEFIYPKGAPFGPGLPKADPRVDFQELNSYLEVAANSRLSGFVEAPVRFLHPEVNAPATGFGDMNAGFKWGVICTSDLLATFQLRTYFPTGDSHRGLGTDHFTLEPAFLANYRYTDWLTVESELRYWAPLDGTDFAGDIVRYGVGLTFGKRCPNGFWATPVTELVGWTVLGGKETVVLSPTLAPVESARGDTIINGKVGLRFGYGDRADIYTGYGRALTGDVWYKNTFRVELRWRF